MHEVVVIAVYEWLTCLQEARKYHASSRMIQIQAEIAGRAIELLALPVSCYCKLWSLTQGVYCAHGSLENPITSWTSVAAVG